MKTAVARNKNLKMALKELYSKMKHFDHIQKIRDQNVGFLVVQQVRSFLICTNPQCRANEMPGWGGNLIYNMKMGDACSALL